MARIESNPNTKVVALNGNRLGQIGGAVVACVVMAFSFYMREVDAFTAFTRVGWAFVIGYGATFFLVRVILVTTLRQMVEERRRTLEERRAGRDEVLLVRGRARAGPSPMAAAEEETTPESGLER